MEGGNAVCREKKRIRSFRTASVEKIFKFGCCLGEKENWKSTLVEKFLEGKNSWSFSGIPPHENKTSKEEIDSFVNQMTRNIGMPKLKTEDWAEVFWHLGNQAQKEKEIVIFFDEISWMGSKDENFLGYLKTEWDRTFSKCSNLILILCGSVSNWIEDKIINSTGFYGRISIKLKVEELPLPDCNEFWKVQGDRISAFEKFKVLGVTGGVPKYLEEVIPTESAEKNINELCFRKEGLLFREYKQIFYDLFSRRAGTFDKIIRTLLKGSKNLDEICSELKIEKSGNISKYLHDLISVGFVSEDKTWNIKSKKKSNLKRFRLSDNYIRFYLKFIEPNITKIEQNGFTSYSIAHLPGWETIMGLQFENLVINNINKLYEILNISIQDVVKSGPFFQKKSTKNKGCQIDLLIQAKYNTLYLCEIKFLSKDVGRLVVGEVEEKIKRLSYPKGYTVRPILIHVNGVTQGVLESDLFDKIIDFSDFFIK